MSPQHPAQQIHADGRRGTETLTLAENLYDRRLALGVPPLTVDCIGAKA